MLCSMFWQREYVQAWNFLEILGVRRDQYVLVPGSSGCETVSVGQAMTGLELGSPGGHSLTGVENCQGQQLNLLHHPGCFGEALGLGQGVVNFAPVNNRHAERLLGVPCLFEETIHRVVAGPTGEKAIESISIEHVLLHHKSRSLPFSTRSGSPRPASTPFM